MKLALLLAATLATVPAAFADSFDCHSLARFQDGQRNNADVRIVMLPSGHDVEVIVSHSDDNFDGRKKLAETSTRKTGKRRFESPMRGGDRFVLEMDLRTERSPFSALLLDVSDNSACADEGCTGDQVNKYPLQCE